MLAPPIFLGFLSSAANELFRKGAKHLLATINQRLWQRGSFSVVVKGQLSAAQCQCPVLHAGAGLGLPATAAEGGQWWQHGEAVWWGAVGPEEKVGTPGGWWGQPWAEHANELRAFRPALVKANTAVLRIAGTRCCLGWWRRGWDVEVGMSGADVQAHWLLRSLCSLVCPILGANALWTAA